MTTISRALFLLLGTAVIGQGQTTYSKCDILHLGTTNVVDVQAIINEALGVSPPNNDLNGDGAVNVVDVQIVINAALGLGCSADIPAIASFSPTSAPIGTLVTVTGANLILSTGAAQITLVQQGGGTIAGPIASASATTLTFVIPAGAATGAIQVTTLGNTASSATPLTVVPSSTFSVTASPGSANLIQGQSITYSVGLTSTGTFTQLAALSVTGLPAGATAAFVPTQITLGQTSVLTVSAPLAQPTGSSTLTVTAAATVSGIPVTSTANVTLNVIPVSTSFRGRTVVDNTTQTSLAGVTVSTVGQNGAGASTGCTGFSATSDASGNFALTNLPAACLGPQLIGFNGNTVTSPPGIYAGLQLVFTLVSNTVVVSPVLVNLPQVNTAETFNVIQNDTVDQTYSFTTIPGLSVTVYAGTVFTEQNGSQPNPFPLAAIQVPVDRLPDVMPTTSAGVTPFIVAFQPAETNASQAVAVSFPNTLNVAPGTDMPLMTLDPTQGRMVPYGTGTVSNDGTTIIPDINPATTPHRYGIVHFDWHGPMVPTPTTTNPAPPASGGSPGSGAPAAGPGPGPGNGSGPGGPTPAPPVPSLPPSNPPPPPCSSCPCNASASLNSGPGRDVQKVDGPALAGDPVDLFSGIQVITNTDIAFAGSRGPISLVRTYRSLSSNPGPFGIGTGHNYSLQLDLSALVQSGQGIINLAMPDGNQYTFNKTSSGTFTNTTIPAFAGAVISTPPSGGYALRYRNGTTYTFQTSALGGLEAFLTTITDPNGNTISLTLNPSQPLQVTQITDPVGRSLMLSYDGSNRITLITDPIGRTVQYAYNPQGTLASVTDPAGGVTHYTYDANNNMLSVTDPRGIVQAQNTLDSVGRVIQQVRPDGGVLTFAYTPLNALVETSQMMGAQVTDSQGVQATYRFNPNGFVVGVTATQGQARQVGLIPGSNFLQSVTEAGTTRTYTYDGNGNILSTTDATGLTTQFTYEPVFNHVTSITDPLGNVSRFTYDANGNLLTAPDANGNVSSYQYDPTGLLVQLTDALNQKTKFTYDPFGNLASVTDPLGNTTSYFYDGISRLLTAIDSLGNRTSSTYDGLGRLLTSTNAQGGVTKFSYDPNGNLLTVTDPRSNTTAFTYDVMNRLATRTNPLGKMDTRTYDTNGNLIKFVDRRGIVSTFAYDNLNRLVTELYADATVSRTYDVLGRVIQVNDTASGTFLSSYDLAGRLLSSATPFGSVNYTYDGRGAMASRQVADQAALSYSYDPGGNLIAAVLPQASANFSYNPRNQISSIGRLNGVSTRYSYDADARLLSLTHANGSALIDTESYGYDAVGNRNSHSTSIGQALITQPTANQFNVANQLTLFGAIPDSYDANGNLVQESNTTAYTWDGRNRLKSIVTAAGQTTNFTYDYAGNLIQQADSGTSLNLTKSFVLDSMTNVATEAASDGTSYSVLSGRAIDSHLAIVQSSGQVQYGLSDAINSTTTSVDQGGVVKAQLLYEPFGLTTTSTAYPFQFTGRSPASASTYHFRARFFNPGAGRFISEDPIGFAAGLNFYVYGSNSPIDGTDPTGLWTQYPPPACLGAVLTCGGVPFGIPAFGCVVGAIVCTYSVMIQPPPPLPPPPRLKPPGAPTCYMMAAPPPLPGLMPGTNNYWMIQPQ